MTEHKLSEQELQEIREEAEKKYRTLSINLVAGQPPSDFNYSERQAYIAGAIAALTRERERVKGLVEALEEIIRQKLEPGEKDYQYAFNRNWHIATEALNNYNQNNEV